MWHLVVRRGWHRAATVMIVPRTLSQHLRACLRGPGEVCALRDSDRQPRGSSSHNSHCLKLTLTAHLVFMKGNNGSGSGSCSAVKERCGLNVWRKWDLQAKCKVLTCIFQNFLVLLAQMLFCCFCFFWLCRVVTEWIAHLQPCCSAFYNLFKGMTLRPDRPASVPDPTQTRRVQQIHIPVIIPAAPSSPRKPYNPRQPVQPNMHTIRISPPSQPSAPHQPGNPVVPLIPIRPVVETGEAGPPGYVRRVTVRRGSEDSSDRPVKGFAGAPGEQS